MTDATAASSEAPSTGFQVALLLTSTLTVMAGAVIAPSLEAIAEHFDRTVGDTRIVLTTPALAIMLSGPLWGWLGDRLGRRGPLLAALAIYAGGGSFGYFAQSFELLLASRAALGVAVAGTMSLTAALIGDTLSGGSRRGFVGLQAVAMGLGGLVFLNAGGLLGALDWRYPFLLYALALPVAFMLLLCPAPAAPSHAPRDPETSEEGPPSEGPLGFRGHPILIGLFVCIASAIFYLLPIELASFLRDFAPLLGGEAGQAQPVRAGLAMGLATLAGAVASFYWPRWRMQRTPVTLASYAFGAFSIGLFILSTAPATFGYGCVLFGAGVVGFGGGLVLPTALGWMLQISPAARRGLLTSALTTALFAGHFLSPWLADLLRVLHGPIGMVGSLEGYDGDRIGLYRGAAYLSFAGALLCTMFANRERR